LRKALYFLACYGAVVVGVAEAAGHFLLGALFGARFTSMAPVFTLLCMGIAWYAVGFPAGYTLIARGQSKRLLAGSATAAILNISLNLALIPVVGPIGAATATFVAFVAASVVWLRAHEMLDRTGVRMLTALTAVTVGGLVVLMAPTARLPIGVATISIAVLFAGLGWRQIPPASRDLGSLLR
jgi:O-antigen/teichoic acid export membrane protein